MSHFAGAGSAGGRRKFEGRHQERRRGGSWQGRASRRQSSSGYRRLPYLGGKRPRRVFGGMCDESLVARRRAKTRHGRTLRRRGVYFFLCVLGQQIGMLLSRGSVVAEPMPPSPRFLQAPLLELWGIVLCLCYRAQTIIRVFIQCSTVELLSAILVAPACDQPCALLALRLFYPSRSS